jgi:hypothetical protein
MVFGSSRIICKFLMKLRSSLASKSLKPTSMVLLALLGVLPVVAIPSAYAAPPVPFAAGDVFAGVGSGHINQFSPTGTLKDTLDTTTGSGEDTGMCFDASGNMYATDFTASEVSTFDSSGNLVAAAFGSGYSHPESCVLDNAGDIYVSGAGSDYLLKFSPSGVLLNQYQPLTREDRGVDWIDLAADQCTIYYTSEFSDVLTYNVCTGTQGAPFATGLSPSCYALRIRPGGDVMVACQDEVYHLSGAGAVLKTYPASALVSSTGGSEDSLFALSLDPDGTSFWTGAYDTGNIYRIDIATGAQLTTFNAGISVSLAGLAVFGEITVGCQPNCVGQGVPEFGAPAILVAAMSLVALVFVRRVAVPKAPAVGHA